MKTERKLFLGIVLAVWVLDVALHFVSEWRKVESGDHLSLSMFPALAWNTLAGSLEFLESAAGVLTIVALILLFGLIHRRGSPGEPPPSEP